MDALDAVLVSTPLAMPETLPLMDAQDAVSASTPPSTDANMLETHMDATPTLTLSPGSSPEPAAKQARLDQEGGANEAYVIHEDTPTFNMRRAHHRRYHDLAEETMYTIEFTNTWRGQHLTNVW